MCTVPVTLKLHVFMYHYWLFIVSWSFSESFTVSVVKCKLCCTLYVWSTEYNVIILQGCKPMTLLYKSWGLSWKKKISSPSWELNPWPSHLQCDCSTSWAQPHPQVRPSFSMFHAEKREDLVHEITCVMPSSLNTPGQMVTLWSCPFWATCTYFERKVCLYIVS